MSGHSKWSKVKHFKGAVDTKRSKLFTKLVREITVAARLGVPDPDANARLRLAIQTARDNSMPKDTVERAIKKATGAGEDFNYEEVLYEGYGPGKFAVVVEAMTDNRNRTASVIRTVFNKGGGTLGSSNSVLFLFERKGTILVPNAGLTEDQLTEHVLEAGGDDIQDLGEEFLVTCALEAFGAVRAYLESKQVRIKSAGLERVPTTKIMLETQEAAEKALAFLSALEDEDDVQNVYANFDIPDAVLARLS
jgi:YebC/PmpR family DNA-binding regulatory protein